jgi:hydroxyacylglutathione hydrolase
VFFEMQKEYLFCGDVLFSMGCGRVIEGNMQDMYQSLQRFKALPLSTKIFCGHEYTEKNSQFTNSYSDSSADYITKILSQLKRKGHSMGFCLQDELNHNLFLKAKTETSFADLRKARDHF